MVRDGFKGVIYSTPPPKIFGGEFNDSLGVLEKKPKIPVNRRRGDAGGWSPVVNKNFRELFILSGNLKVTFRDALATFWVPMIEITND